MHATNFPLPLPEQTRHRLLVAGVVVAIGLTPTLLDAVLVWKQEPQWRWLIVAAWIFAGLVAWNAWELFDNQAAEVSDGDDD